MSNHLYRKFLLGYVVFGLVGLALVCGLGSYIIKHDDLFNLITDSHENLLIVIVICFLVIYGLSFVMLRLFFAVVTDLTSKNLIVEHLRLSTLYLCSLI